VERIATGGRIGKEAAEGLRARRRARPGVGKRASRAWTVQRASWIWKSWQPPMMPCSWEGFSRWPAVPTPLANGQGSRPLIVETGFAWDQ
jgi:hypothetical protein